MERLILASSSPRRRDLLNSIGVKFEVIESNFDESILERRKRPTEFVTASAYGKASDVFDRTDHGIVLAADTVVVFEDEIYGKPKDEDDARRMLRKFNNDVHEVMTGVVLMGREGETVITREVTEVFFNKLEDDDIEAYIKTKDYIGKAGAYGIQGKGAVLIRGIKGSYSNVVGLPIDTVCRMLKQLDESIYDRWS